MDDRSSLLADTPLVGEEQPASHPAEMLRKDLGLLRGEHEVRDDAADTDVEALLDAARKARSSWWTSASARWVLEPMSL